MNLYMFYVGGMIKGCNIEQHDIQFVIGSDITNCFGTLKEKWWGIPETLHIDCWAEIHQADGYRVEVDLEHKHASDLQLFLVNVGGYAGPDEFSERHQNFLIIAEDAGAAKVKAIKKITDWPGRHMDKISMVDAILNVSDQFKFNLKLVGLDLNVVEASLNIQHQYLRIGKDHII